MTLEETSQDALLLRAQAEAAAWVALLHSGSRDAKVDAGLKSWIAADPLHAKVWEVTTDVWNETEGGARRIPLRQVAWNRRPRHVFHAMAASVVALSLLAAGGWVYRYFSPPSVSTGVGEQRTLNLEDGTRVELNTNTRIEVKFDSKTRSVVLRSGEAYFQVAHESRPFEVIAGDRTVYALGTAFLVRRDQSADDALTVTLIEGRVAVSPRTVTNDEEGEVSAGTVVLSAGERFNSHRHTKPAVDAPSIDKATGWMRGQLIFDHTRLGDAAAEFSRYDRIKVTVASPDAAQIPVSGIFRIGDSRSFAHAVADTYNLKVTENGDELVLTPIKDDPAP